MRRAHDVRGRRAPAGKTTTSALLAPCWPARAGPDPRRRAIPQLGAGAAWGGGGPFVVEADESDGTFLDLGAEAVIVTNVEPDHLDHWGGEAALRDAFRRFVAALPGPAVVCADDAGARAAGRGAAGP